MYVPLPLKKPEAEKTPVTFKLEPKHDLTAFAADDGNEDGDFRALESIAYSPVRGEVVATDGRVLAMVKVGEPQDGPLVMMDPFFVRRAINSGSDVRVVNGVPTRDVHGKDVTPEPISGRFPNYASCIPDRDPATTSLLNAKYIVAICNHIIAECERVGKEPLVYVSAPENPESPWVFEDRNEQTFVLMPLAYDKSATAAGATQ